MSDDTEQREAPWEERERKERDFSTMIRRITTLFDIACSDARIELARLMFKVGHENCTTHTHMSEAECLRTVDDAVSGIVGSITDSGKRSAWLRLAIVALGRVVAIDRVNGHVQPNITEAVTEDNYRKGKR